MQSFTQLELVTAKFCYRELEQDLTRMSYFKTHFARHVQRSRDFCRLAPIASDLALMVCLEARLAEEMLHVYTRDCFARCCALLCELHSLKV